jgi:site-specific DNA-cytosine methylase
MKLILISLFNGLGGASIALNNENITPIKTYFSEIDKFANKVYLNNFPNSINLGDVTKIDNKTIEDIKNEALKNNAKILLIAGSPCQNLSIFGNKKGLSTKCDLKIKKLDDYLMYKNNNFEFDGQSYLFWEFIRIKNELNPYYFILENVRMSKEWRDVFDKNVGIKHIYIDSKIVSVQSRKRLYWSNLKHILPNKHNHLVVKDILDKNAIFVKPKGTLLNKWGNSIRLTKVTNINNKCHTLTASMFRNNISRYVKDENNDVHKLTVNECERLQGVPVGYCNSVSTSRALKMLGNGFEVNTIRLFIKALKKQSIFFDFNNICTIINKCYHNNVVEYPIKDIYNILHKFDDKYFFYAIYYYKNEKIYNLSKKGYFLNESRLLKNKLIEKFINFMKEEKN